jgi:hypothetical protein
MKKYFRAFFFVILILTCVVMNTQEISFEYNYPKIYFDKDNCSEEYSYNTLFNKKWITLKYEFLYRISSHVVIDFRYLMFDNSDTIRFIDGVYSMNNRIYSSNVEQVGIYRFDDVYNILFVKYSTGQEFVFEVRYYNYSKNSWNYVLELYQYKNVTWDTPIEEIIKKEREYYETFIDDIKEIF